MPCHKIIVLRSNRQLCIHAHRPFCKPNIFQIYSSVMSFPMCKRPTLVEWDKKKGISGTELGTAPYCLPTLYQLETEKAQQSQEEYMSITLQNPYVVCTFSACELLCYQPIQSWMRLHHGEIQTRSHLHLSLYVWASKNNCWALRYKNRPIELDSHILHSTKRAPIFALALRPHTLQRQSGARIF